MTDAKQPRQGPPPELPSLERSLSRMNEALKPAPALDARVPARGTGRGEAVAALGALALAFFVAALATGHPGWIALAVLLAAAGGAVYALPEWSGLFTAMQGGSPSSTRASIGLGATVAAGAVIEPGASVEMGAVVRRGAVVRAGAVVRMGAVISRDAVVERGAVVSWGAVVNRGAVVGENALVGAGAIVRRDARVAPGMRLSPGAIYAARDTAGAPALGAAGAAPGAALAAAGSAPGAALAAAVDPRDERLAAVCDRLEAELKSSPEQVRAFLGGSGRTIASLRHTCEDLSRRERAMREEADPRSVAQLEDEHQALQRRLAGERDPQLAQSLQGALAAIDELKRQRQLLRLGADRLRAEHTRLLYTLEGLASQFVRLRTAGAGAAPAELEEGVLQLRAGIDAIADALEEVSREAPAALRELATAPDAEAAEGEPSASPARSRSR